LRGDSDQLFRSAIEAGWRSAQSLAAIMARLAAEVGISPPQYSILMVLAYAPAGLAIGALAARLRVSQPFITAEVGKLAAAKIVVRRQNPADKRSVLVALSVKGRGITSRLAMLLREINDFIYQDISRKEFDAVRKFAARLALRSELALERMGSDRRMFEALSAPAGKE